MNSTLDCSQLVTYCLLCVMICTICAITSVVATVLYNRKKDTEDLKR